MATTKVSQNQTTDAILEARGVSVEFDMERGKSRVLNDVDLDIERQEVLGIVGESGSGKSMLASAMLDAVVEPGQLSGSITFRPEDGEPVEVLDLSDEELRRLRWEEIAMVFQGAMSSFNPTMSVREHFLETLDAHNVDKDDGMRQAYRLLADLYLEPERVMTSYPHELSGGMKQRTLIALSLVLQPELLIMDEPTAALDLLMQRSIVNLLRTLKEEYDLTLVFITHDLPLVARLADRLCVLYAFEVAEIGDTTDIIHDSAHPYTRMLLKSTPDIDAPVEEMKAIEGASPDPVNVPAGCSYHPRCPIADEYCRSSDPELEPVHTDKHDDHTAACFNWEDAAQGVPLALDELLGEEGEQ